MRGGGRRGKIVSKAAPARARSPPDCKRAAGGVHAARLRCQSHQSRFFTRSARQRHARWRLWLGHGCCLRPVAVLLLRFYRRSKAKVTDAYGVCSGVSAV